MVWLLTGLPALAVFLAIPAGSQAMKIAAPILMLMELAYLGQIAQSALRIKQATGRAPPLKERMKLAPWAFGVLIYVLVFIEVLSGEAKVLLGSVAVALGSATKIWIARSPLRSVAEVAV